MSKFLLFLIIKTRRIIGATGINASLVNGIYVATEEMSGGMPVYRKQDNPDRWLMLVEK